MRKIYLLLAVLTYSILLRAQSTPTVNFSYAVQAGTTNVSFANTSQNLGEGEKKAVWTFGDNTTASTGGYQGIAHPYAAPGTYRVCLKIYRNVTASSNGTLIGEQCKEVVVPPARQVCEAGIQGEPAGSSGSKTINFVGLGHSNPTKSIKRVCWDFGDGSRTCETVSQANPSSGLLKVSHSYSLPGTYNVCIRIEFEGGCVAERCKPFTVAPPPPAVCEVNFVASPMGASALGRNLVVQPKHSQQKKPVRICWKFGDGTADVCKNYGKDYTGAYAVEHIYAHAGNYESCVTVQYEDGCEKKICRLVAVAPPPPPVCKASVYEIPVSNAASTERKFGVELVANKPARQILWTFGDGKSQVVTVTNPATPQQLKTVHNYSAPGLYTVCIRVTYDGGCVAEHCIKTTIGGHVRPALVLSPNPAVTTLTAVFQSSRQQPVTVSVFNSYGILLFQQNKNAVMGTNTWSFNVGFLPIGMYSMIVQSPQQLATAIFSKQ